MYLLARVGKKRYTISNYLREVSIEDLVDDRLIIRITRQAI